MIATHLTYRSGLRHPSGRWQTASTRVGNGCETREPVRAVGKEESREDRPKNLRLIVSLVTPIYRRPVQKSSRALVCEHLKTDAGRVLSHFLVSNSRENVAYSTSHALHLVRAFSVIAADRGTVLCSVVQVCTFKVHCTGAVPVIARLTAPTSVHGRNGS